MKHRSVVLIVQIKKTLGKDRKTTFSRSVSMPYTKTRKDFVLRQLKAFKKKRR